MSSLWLVTVWHLEDNVLSKYSLSVTIPAAAAAADSPGAG